MLTPSPSHEMVRYQWPTTIEEDEEPPQPQLKKRISVKRHRAIEITRFAENENDEDFSDILGTG